MGATAQRLQQSNRRSRRKRSSNNDLFVEIDGLEEMLDACTDIEKNLAKRIKNAIEPIMEALNAEAKATAPNVTGTLRDQFGYRLKMFNKGKVVWGIQSVIGNKLIETEKGKRRPSKYFHLVTGGTRFAKANPFYDKLTEKYDKLIKETIDKVIEEDKTKIP